MAAAPAPPTVAAVLEVRGLTKSYGAVKAVSSVDLALDPNSTTAIIGPNGAGKTTLLKMIAGAERPTSGEVLLDGNPIHGLGAAKASHLGVGYAHQVPQPFHGLTALDNIRVGIVEHGIEDGEAWANHVLELCGLENRAHRLASELQVLDLKRLGLARAIATRPSLLLLDEVCAGLNGSELDALINLIATLRDEGPTIVLVEHIEAVVSQLASRIVVLDWGKLIADGTPSEVASDPMVKQIYMGAGSTRGSTHKTPEFSTEVTSDQKALVIKGLRAGYGAIEAVHGVDIMLRPGKITAILGANGAGKSTLTSAISGVVAPTSGEITLDGTRIEGLERHRRNAAGVAVIPEGRKIFSDLTVGENLLLPVHFTIKMQEAERRLEEVFTIFPQLQELLERKGGALSGGQQQMVAIGRALMSQPKYLVCDEVSLGLAPVAIDALYEGLVRIAERGIGLAIIEQHVQRVLAVADIAYVMDRGEVTYTGDPRTLNDAEKLNEVYFGASTQK